MIEQRMQEESKRIQEFITHKTDKENHNSAQSKLSESSKQEASLIVQAIEVVS